MRLRRTLAAGLVWPLSSGALLGQQPSPPTFPSGVEVVSVDVNVVDGQGNPIRDLAAGDFLVKVDGQARKVLSAEFIAAAAATAGAEREAGVARAMDVAPAPGRLIVLAIDRGQVSAGALRLAIDSAQDLVARLPREDRVAVFSLPSGPRIDVTRDRTAVRKTLDKIGPLFESTLGQYDVGLAEALQFSTGDPRAESAAHRECEEWQGTSAYQGCLADVRAQALQLVSLHERQLRDRLAALDGLCRGLASIPGPKIMVLLSAGLTSPFYAGATEGMDRMGRVAETAAAARVTLYSLHVRQFGRDFDPSRPRRSYTAEDDERLATEGLEALTGMAGGTKIDVLAAGRGSFDRLAREISGHYLLALEPAPSDHDGKPHALRVEVARRGVEVRARRQFVLGPGTAGPRAAPAGGGDGLSLRVATHALSGGGDNRLKLILVADMDGTAPAEVAYRILDRSGTPAGEGTGTAAGQPGHLRFEEAVLLRPGEYTLKVGVRDAQGRRARDERPVSLKLAGSRDHPVSELLLLERHEGKLRMLAGPTSADEIGVYLELYGRTSEVGEAVSITIEGAGPAAWQMVKVQRDPGGGRAHAEAVVSLRSFPAGKYRVQAAVMKGSGTVARVERAFERRAGLRQ